MRVAIFLSVLFLVWQCASCMPHARNQIKTAGTLARGPGEEVHKYGNQKSAEPQNNCFMLTNSTGWYTSPGYPLDYPNDLDCYGMIFNNHEDALGYTSTTFIDINTEITYDYIVVRSDGANGPLLANMSGTYLREQPFTSPTSLYVHFHTDESMTYRGFNATYNTDLGDVCSMSIQSGRAIIESPNYPDDYPNNADCYWVLGQSGMQTTIYFQDFQTQANLDVVEVRAESPSGEVLARYSGSNGQCQEISYFSKLWVHFTSDPLITRSGFWAEVSIDDPVTLCDSYTTLPHPTTTKKLPDATMGEEMELDF